MVFPPPLLPLQPSQSCTGGRVRLVHRCGSSSSTSGFPPPRPRLHGPPLLSAWTPAPISLCCRHHGSAREEEEARGCGKDTRHPKAQGDSRCAGNSEWCVCGGGSGGRDRRRHLQWLGAGVHAALHAHSSCAAAGEAQPRSHHCHLVSMRSHPERRLLHRDSEEWGRPTAAAAAAHPPPSVDSFRRCQRADRACKNIYSTT